ncbi:peptidoglycan DD-metalloendopeptidase family protein [Paenibacillus sp. CMAA1364]
MKGFKSMAWVRKISMRAKEYILPLEKPVENKKKSMMDYSQKGKSSSMDKRRSILLASMALIAVTCVAVFASNQYVEANKIAYYNVYVKDEMIGSVDNPTQIEQLFSQKSQELKNEYPEVDMVLQTKDITTKAEIAFKAEVDSESTLKKLKGMLVADAKGVEMRIDGKVVAIVKDQQTVDDILSQIKNQYLPKAEKERIQFKKMSHSVPASSISVASAPESNVKSVDIVEDVNVIPIQTTPDLILSSEEVTTLLTQTNEAPIEYTIEEGDTLSSIVSRLGITEKQIYTNNPQIKEKYLQIGDTLKLTVPKLPITVTTLEQVSEEIVTAPQVEIRKTDQLEAGKSKVVRPGQEGLKVMEYLVTKENGQLVDEQWIGQEVIQESITEVVLQGTKIAGQGSGQFAWPVSSPTISSTYGARWGRQHKGIDIVSGNRTIMASDEGVVTFTGNINGYGKAVMINHKNGYTTLYGHLNSYSVHQGQTVSKGGSIGIMGNTGRSTGTHLHFEILKNDIAQNPMKYLN